MITNNRIWIEDTEVDSNLELGMPSIDVCHDIQKWINWAPQKETTTYTRKNEQWNITRELIHGISTDSKGEDILHERSFKDHDTGTNIEGRWPRIEFEIFKKWLIKNGILPDPRKFDPQFQAHEMRIENMHRWKYIREWGDQVIDLYQEKARENQRLQNIENRKKYIADQKKYLAELFKQEGELIETWIKSPEVRSRVKKTTTGTLVQIFLALEEQSKKIPMPKWVRVTRSDIESIPEWFRRFFYPQFPWALNNALDALRKSTPINPIKKLLHRKRNLPRTSKKK